MQVKLGEEQQQAVDNIIDFIKNSKNTCFSLYGPAGTGKSLLLSHIISFLENSGYDFTV